MTRPSRTEIPQFSRAVARHYLEHLAAGALYQRRVSGGWEWYAYCAWEIERLRAHGALDVPCPLWDCQPRTLRRRADRPHWAPYPSESLEGPDERGPALIAAYHKQRAQDVADATLMRALFGRHAPDTRDVVLEAGSGQEE